MFSMTTEQIMAHAIESMEDLISEKLLDRLELLLTLDAMNINEENFCAYNLVIRALRSGKTDFAKLLIEKGCEVYKASNPNQKTTLLQAAIQSEDQDLIRTVLAKGASPDILTFDKQNKTLLHLVIEKNQLDIIDLFLPYFDAKIFDEKYFLHYAIEQDNIEIVSKLIAKGLSLTKKNEKGLTPFCVATNDENFKILDCLLSHHAMKNVIPNDQDDIPPAYIAIIRGNLKVIKKYIDSGLAINIPLNFCADTWPSLNNWLVESGFTLLHFAVKLVKLKIVKYLLSIGADILVKDSNGSSPLHVAFEAKEKGIWKTWQDFDDNNSIIDTILKIHTKFNSNPINNRGLSHFHIACSRDEPTVVEHFLKLGVAINQPVQVQCHRYKKFSPLHFAAKFRCKRTVELLLKNGADVRQRDFQKMTALHIAAKESCLEVVNLLLQYGADIASVDSHGKIPIHWAFEERHYRVIDLLLSVPNVAKSNPTDSRGLSHFHIACTRNNVNVVKSFIERGVCIHTSVPTKLYEDKNPDVDWCGYSPLHFAVSHNRAKIVRLLLDSGANVKLKDSKGVTPFELACQNTHEMFGELIGNSLCDFSKHKKLTQKLYSLTDVATVDEEYIKFSGPFPLYNYGYIQQIDWSASRKDYLKIMRLLLDYGSDVNCVDDEGNAPVFHAYSAVNKIESILKNNLNCSETLWAKIIEFLREELCERRKLIMNNFLKLDVNLNNCYKNRSILHYIVCTHKANDKQSDEMVRLFLKHGANINAKDENMLTPLYQAVSMEKESLVRILLDYDADVHCIDPRDNATPLLTAASQFKPTYYCNDVIKILLAKGANPDARQSNGRAAIHNLASRPYPSLGVAISNLMEAGANVDSQDSKGHTALRVACKMRNDEALKILLMHGADVNVEDKKGRSVYCYLYEKHLEDFDEDEDDMPDNVAKMLITLQKHVIRMNVIGLPLSEKVLVSNSKFKDFETLAEEEKVELNKKCQSEVQLLRDTKIHDNCTLFDAIFKSENALSHLVKIRTFKNLYIAQCNLSKKMYPQYGHLVQFKYRLGVHRGNFLPMAKLLLDKLAGMRLPDICSENICEYFSNVELKESIANLRGILDLKVEMSDEIRLRGFKTDKRQKVN